MTISQLKNSNNGDTMVMKEMLIKIIVITAVNMDILCSRHKETTTAIARRISMENVMLKMYFMHVLIACLCAVVRSIKHI